MNDYDLFMRCKTMIERDGYEDDPITGKYVELAIRHLRTTKEHKWLGDELESLTWKKPYHAIPGRITKVSNIEGLYNNPSNLQGAYWNMYLPGGLRF